MPRSSIIVWLQFLGFLAALAVFGSAIFWATRLMRG